MTDKKKLGVDFAALATGVGAPRFELTFNSGTEQVATMEHYLDPWVPKGVVVGVYGRGESGKSSWINTMCAKVSDRVSTLWVTSEELQAHVSVRYSATGGEPGTLVVLPANPKVEGEQRVSVFDVFTNLEATVLQMQARCRPERPLGIVVLDAVTSLVTWAKGENANDDGGVKRLLAHLHTLAEKHGLTILIVGHMNKNTEKKHGPDAVTGSAAWTNSPRRCFMFYKDVAADTDYEGFIRTAKANLGTHFAVKYKTVPVHIVHERKDAPSDVLCRTEFTSDLVWGNKAINELMNDTAEEDPNHQAKKNRQKKKDDMLISVANAIRMDGCRSREAIKEKLAGHITLHPYHWTTLDEELVTKCDILVQQAEFNRKVYIAKEHAAGV